MIFLREVMRMCSALEVDFNFRRSGVRMGRDSADGHGGMQMERRIRYCLRTNGRAEILVIGAAEYGEGDYRSVIIGCGGACRA